MEFLSAILDIWQRFADVVWRDRSPLFQAIVGAALVFCGSIAWVVIVTPIYRV